MSPGNKIIVLRGGAIGDFILTLPVFAELRAQYPGVRLEVLGYPAIAGLALAAGLVDAVLPVESPALASFFVASAALDPEWRAYFATASLVLSYLSDPESNFADNVRRCTAAPYIQGPSRPRDGGGIHAVEVLLAPLKSLGIQAASAAPQLPVEPWPLPAGEFWLAAHPGSGSARKNWPAASWEMLLDAWLRWTDAGLVIIGGEAEGERPRRLAEICRARGVRSDRVVLLQHAPLPRVARYLKACQAFVGHDSGITHLAAAVGAPGLALWGETDATVWRPRGDRIQSVHEPAGLSALPPATVLARLLDLRPIETRSPALEVADCAGKILVIGYGNTLRSDDGVGVVVAEAIRLWGLQKVAVMTAHQLTPELAEPMGRAAAVFFIDARLDSNLAGETTCAPLAGPTGGRVDPHLTTPEGLLGLAQALYGRAPRAWVITLPITEVGFGESLTPLAQARAIQARELFLRTLMALPPSLV